MKPIDDRLLFASLRDAYEASRRVAAPGDLQQVLEGIAETISALGWGAVAFNVHRRAFDDFETVVVRGPAPIDELLGTTQTWVQWAPLLHERFARRGAYFIPEESEVTSEIPAVEWDAPARDRDAWRPGDQLVVLMRGGDGEVAGVLSVDSPHDGRRPADAAIDALVAVADAAGAALQQAREGAAQLEHQAAVRHLLSVSARLVEARTDHAVLEAVCRGIRDALGFQCVAIELADESGALVPATSVGWEQTPHIGIDLERFKRIMIAEYEDQGCYVLDCTEALRVLELPDSPYASRRNGEGPWGWHRHWLTVPLRDTHGAIQGFIWADDPIDLLLPGTARLQALRLFADQAQAALESARHFEHTRHLAEHDPLTGLPNRRRLLGQIGDALQRARLTRRTTAVLFVDLDRFKGVNDTHGHDVGDELLRTVAARLQESVRPGDAVARLGGDEFVVLCADIRGQSDALDVAERIRRRVAEPVEVGRLKLSVSASVGVALPIHGTEDAGALLRYADVAMYRAKDAGRDAMQVASADLRAGASARAHLERTLSGALARGEIHLAWQPVVCTATGRPLRAEAMMRWVHPGLGPIPPLEFIPLAEENGSIVELGRWALEEACAQWRTWRDALGEDAPGISVNISPRQLRDEGLRDHVAALVAEHRLPPGALTVEITEGVLLEASPSPIGMLAGLRELGCLIDLDDFGTGYSSLSSLADFSVDGLKIDRRFVSKGLRGRDAAIAEAVLAMARAMNLTATAEGVESCAQLEWLRARGCPQAQGFLFAPPLEPEELTAMLLRREPAPVCAPAAASSR